MVLEDVVLDLLSQKVGQDVRTRDGASNLTLHLEKECKENQYMETPPSLNTIKRLVGLLPQTTPYLKTLNVIAWFLDYEDWPQLAEDCKFRLSSAFVRSDRFKHMPSFPHGAFVEVAWNPDRRLVLRHEGNGRYTVLESENCKLIVGDLLSLHSLSIGYPFIADRVFRGGQRLGAYRSADGSALHLLRIINSRI